MAQSLNAARITATTYTHQHQKSSHARSLPPLPASPNVRGFCQSNMNTKNRVELSIMMFLQFFIWGAWYVTAPNYLGTIGFNANDFGWTYSVGPIAGMISPFFVGMIADRFFAAQKVLGVMHILGAALMLGATVMMKAATPSPDAIN